MTMQLRCDTEVNCIVMHAKCNKGKLYCIVRQVKCDDMGKI